MHEGNIEKLDWNKKSRTRKDHPGQEPMSAKEVSIFSLGEKVHHEKRINKIKEVHQHSNALCRQDVLNDKGGWKQFGSKTQKTGNNWFDLRDVKYLMDAEMER